ncbi:hypothetical protein [Phormidium sp. CCY1219]|nr:hypothetical protein [Phormidium sp. CCY1219]
MQTQCRTTQIDRQTELSALKSYFISVRDSVETNPMSKARGLYF